MATSDAEMLTVTVEKMDRQIWRRFRAWCVANDRLTGDAMAEAITRYLDKYDRPDGR